MAKYRVTAPDGKTFDIEGEGTQEEALAHFQSTYKPQAETKPLAANAGAVNLAANLAGLPVDTIQNVMNLGIAGYGRLTGKGGDAPEPISAFGGSESIKRGLRSLGMPGLSPDNPDPASKLGTAQFDLMSRGGAIPGGFLAALGSMTAEKVGGPEWAGVGAMAPAAAGAGARAAGLPTAQDAGRRLMQSALKPTLNNLRNGNAARAITTMLEEGFNATPGGVAAMRQQIGALNDEISQAIANSPATVNRAEVANSLQPLLQRVARQVNPNADIATVQAAWHSFMDHPLLQGSPTMPVGLAQTMKQGTYRELGNRNYGEIRGADIEAQKTLARALKDAIAREVPEVTALNARESRLLNAAGIAERRALMDGNKNPAGLGWLAHEPAAAIGFLADRSALAKSLLARGLFSGGRVGALSQANPVISRGVLAEILSEQEK